MRIVIPSEATYHSAYGATERTRMYTVEWRFTDGAIEQYHFKYKYQAVMFFHITSKLASLFMKWGR